MTQIQVECSFCKKTDPVRRRRYGKGATGHPGYRCRDCNHRSPLLQGIKKIWGDNGYRGPLAETKNNKKK